AGVVVALLSVNEGIFDFLRRLSADHGLTEALGNGGFQIIGVLFFALMGGALYKVAKKPQPHVE
ncbi:MAG: hypothetical protein HYZ34_14185, partial [Ignavibacteriae bacterium]|nr:hypothetical protein [Ignavibacteriota bacterium]